MQERGGGRSSRKTKSLGNKRSFLPGEGGDGGRDMDESGRSGGGEDGEGGCVGDEANGSSSAEVHRALIVP